MTTHATMYRPGNHFCAENISVDSDIQTRLSNRSGKETGDHPMFAHGIDFFYDFR